MVRELHDPQSDEERVELGRGWRARGQEEGEGCGGALRPSTHLRLSSYSSNTLRVFCKHTHREENRHFGV